MELGISNLAWHDSDQLKNIICLLQDNNISYIEVVLPKYLDWRSNDLTILNQFMDTIKSSGLRATTTQAIFYGTGINSFADDGFVQHLSRVSRICKQVGIDTLVLGAPSMRSS